MSSDDEEKIIETLRSLPGTSHDNAGEIARIAMEGGRGAKRSFRYGAMGALAACAALAFVFMMPSFSKHAGERSPAQTRGSDAESLPQLVIFAGDSAHRLVENASPKLQQEVSAHVVFSTPAKGAEKNFSVYLDDKDALTTLHPCSPIPAAPRSVKLSTAFRLEKESSQLVLALFEGVCSAELLRQKVAGDAVEGIRIRTRALYRGQP